MTRIDTALFDFDGTIMDTNDLIIESWHHTFNKLLGRPPDEKKLLDTFGEPIDDCVSKLFPDSDAEEVKRVYRSYQFLHYDTRIHLFPGVRDLIENLHGIGVKMAVVTNRLRNSTERGLALFGLDTFIETVVAVDDIDALGLRAKPEPDAVLHTLSLMNSEPESSILVGDTLNDIRSGNLAELTTVRVGWSVAEDGFHDTESGDAKPDYIINQPSELLDIIGR